MNTLPVTSDTSPDIQDKLLEIYRQMSPAEKWRCVAGMKHRARMLHAAGYRLRHPSATPRDIEEEWIRLTLGATLADTLTEARRALDG